MNDDDFAAGLRRALEDWEAVLEYASTIEDELWGAARENRFHPGWTRIREAHDRLTIVGLQCMTPEQAARKPLVVVSHDVVHAARLNLASGGVLRAPCTLAPL